MTLRELLRKIDLDIPVYGPDVEVTGVSIDSRRCERGHLFVCMPGMTADSERFVTDAANHGASSAMVFTQGGREIAEAAGLTVFLVADAGLAFNDAVWRLCDAFFDYPTEKMRLIGVTGTNGKTTTAWMLRDMLASQGVRAGYLGTLGFHIEGESRELPNTTPFAVDLYRLLAEARDRGMEAMAIEVSSHALAQHRADGLEFDAAIFTNLTQDHLDFHGSMEEYEAAKFRLFDAFPAYTDKSFVAVLNGEDPTGRAWSHRISTRGVVFGTHPNLLESVPPACEVVPPVAFIASGAVDPIAFQAVAFEDHLRHLVCEPLEIGVDHLTVRLYGPHHQGDARTAKLALGGSYNVQNTAAAAAGMFALGYDLDQVADALGAVHPVPGRFEPVRNDAGIGILVDYAHTPDALEKLLAAVRPLTRGRVIVVFGCGGDRDRTKRPLMARIASRNSDLAVVTSDNPRTEDPQAILDEVLTGIVPEAQAVAILDRREAVAFAVDQANPGDVVVIAGKGHENYQILGREKVHMDDRELAREALGRRR